MRRLSLGILFALVFGVVGFGVANATGSRAGYAPSDAWMRLAGHEAQAADVHGSAPIGDRGVRVWGDDRFETAVAISQEIWTPDNVEVVFLATGLNFPDALAGGASTILAGPILLASKDILPQSTADEITRLQPCAVVAFGGPNAISDAVITQAQALTTATC
jgi:hypothetical protein